jgi:hypothetical protein
MSDTSPDDSPTVFLRVYTQPDGRAFLLYEPLDHQVEIQLPITGSSLVEAREKLVEEGRLLGKAEQERFEGSETSASPQQKANRQIKKALEPEKRTRFATFEFYLQTLQFVLAIILCIGIFYKGVELSYDHLSEMGHIVVLALYVAGLAFCLSLMSTDEIRRKETLKIRKLFGPWGMIVLPGLVLFSAAAVFGSGTFLLHKHGLVVLRECAGRAVAPETVTDFYMWHFLKLFPLVDVNEVLKLPEPLCYEQKRVGFLILLFQALVVLPTINTVMYYWKHRQTLSAPPLDYLFDPAWKPNEDRMKTIDANRSIVDSAKT